MLSKEEITLITEQKIKFTPIGYDYLCDWGIIIPLYPIETDPHKIPCNGGCWYIDEKTKDVGFLLLLDYLDYEGKTIRTEF